ncbi:MAG: hypothetical protein ABJZ55_20525 [Fuerstiella sp.]
MQLWQLIDPLWLEMVDAVHDERQVTVEKCRRGIAKIMCDHNVSVFQTAGGSILVRIGDSFESVSEPAAKCNRSRIVKTLVELAAEERQAGLELRERIEDELLAQRRANELLEVGRKQQEFANRWRVRQWRKLKSAVGQLWRWCGRND